MTPAEKITRPIMGNVPDRLAAVFYAAAFAAIAWAAWRFYRRWRLRRKGRSAPRDFAGRLGWRQALWSALRYLVFQRQLLADRYAGVAHLLTFYGFLILFIGTCLVFLEHDTPLHFFYGWFYQAASLVIDLGGLAFLSGLGMFLVRRHAGAGARLLREWWVATLAWLLVAIGVTGFLLEAVRIALDFPAFERWSVVGYSLAAALYTLGMTPAAATTLQPLLWTLHAALCVAFFALLPWKFFSHMAYGAASWAARSRRPRGALATVRLEPGRPPGAIAARELTRLDLLQTDACTTCGRCNAVCPANAAGKPLRPREVVLGIRQALDAGPDEPLTGWVADEALWSCTTCAACNEACPVGIDVWGKIVDLRRGRVEGGQVPAAAEGLFESTAARFNPFQKPHEDRLLFARGLPVPVAAADEPVELLYWIGCAGSFDPEAQPVARAMIRILNHLKINYRVLGTAERCTGDPARRMGEEGLFQELARYHCEQFARHQVRKIVTHCPHCLNTFKNEYAGLAEGSAGNARWEVVHHSQFLNELLAAGRLPLNSDQDGLATFHDPCYLGRGNGVIVPPREVAAALRGARLAEMERSGRNSLCCGAGGGSIWLDVRGRERIEDARFREAEATGAETVITGCPFCKTMLAAARAARQQSTVRHVKDLAELVAEAIGV